MQALAHPAPPSMRGWLLASVGGHLAVVAALLAVATARRLETPLERTVSVQILTPQEFSALTAVVAGVPAPQEPAGETSVASFPPAAPPAPKPQVQPARAPSGMIRATVMLSEGRLADPRSRQAREALEGSDDEERMIQLCNLEAMDQIHAWRAEYKPDRLVAYAMADLRAAGDRLIADGAAVRSGRLWYNLKFRCELSADHRRVTGFEFLLEDPIPEAAWDEHGLEPVSVGFEDSD